MGSGPGGREMCKRDGQKTTEAFMSLNLPAGVEIEKKLNPFLQFQLPHCLASGGRVMSAGLPMGCRPITYKKGETKPCRKQSSAKKWA